MGSQAVGEADLRPTSADDILEAIAAALTEEAPLEIVGQASKREIGRPVQAERTLDLSDLTGVTLYEPEELVLSAKAGTPLAEIETLLAENNQELLFEPADYGPLLGVEAGRGTIGGVLATNLSGPRRLKAGAARDHVLGVHAVSGRGEAFKSGGRVVKNVTGYDLSKGMAGSWGTLAVVTDCTFKVMPRAEDEATVTLSGLEPTTAVAAMAAAMGSACEISSAAWLDAGMESETPLTILRVEGFPQSVAYRADKLSGLLGDHGRAERLIGDESRALWRRLRDVMPFAGNDAIVWRVSVAPTDGPAIVAAVRDAGGRAFMDWAGGLVWAEMPGELENGGERVVRGAVAGVGAGHATLVRAPAPLRASVPVFHPQPEALAALSRRLKANFDPRGVLNPGRMVAGT